MRSVGTILFALWISVHLSGCAAIRGTATDSDSQTTSLQVDVAIITVLPEEYHAVLRKLDNVRRVIESDGRPNVYVWATGEIRSANRPMPRRIVVAMAGEAGEVSGALTTRATIDRWRPQDVLLVGIAGGVHDSVDLGDVVISPRIWGYEHGHLGHRYDAGGVVFFHPDPTLLKAALDLAPEWRGRIEAAAPDEEVLSKVVVGKTASGNKVIENASSAYFAQSLLMDTTVVSVEMEGAGAAAAVGEDHAMGGTTGFLMIRGISDLVEGEELVGPHGKQGRNPQRDLWKKYAADVAASFAVALIESNWPD
jgi:adenosylhomocysteine nucleosidase